VSRRSAGGGGTAWQRADQWTAPLPGSSAADARCWPPRRPTGARRPPAPAKPDVGGAACSRIIDDAKRAGGRTRQGLQEPGAAAPSTGRITTARLPTTARPSSPARRRLGLCPECEAYESKRTTTRPLRIAPRRSRSIRIWLGLQQPWRRYYGLHEYDAALADHAERSGRFPGTCGPIPATACMTEKGEFDQRRRYHRGGHNRSKIRLWFRPTGSGALQEEVITKKGGWESAIADYSEANQARSKSALAVTAHARCHSNNRQYASPFRIAARSSQREPTIPAVQLPRVAYEGLKEYRRATPTMISRSASIQERRGRIGIAAMPICAA